MMFKYNADDRFEVTQDIMIPFSPFSNYRILRGVKGVIYKTQRDKGVYQIELDNKDKMIISMSLLDAWSHLIDDTEVIVDRTDVEKEDKIIKMTADIWNEFKTLEQTHPSDMEDLADAIHDIQKIIAVRLARRIKPEQFVAYKKD